MSFLKRSLPSALIVGVILAMSHSASATLEIRGNLGMIQATPSDLNSTVATTVKNNDLNIDGASLYGGDAIFKFPTSHFGLGVRYDNWDQKKTTTNYVTAGTSGSSEMSMANWSAVIVVRPIDTMVYLGLIGTYGLSTDLHYKLGSTSITDYKSGSASTWSAGLEGGFKMGFLRLGAEVGYASVTGTSMTDVSNTSNITTDLKMAGPYGRLVFGLGL